MKKIRILLADDHGLLRLGLSTLMGLHEDLEVVGGAENGEEAVRLACRLRPDVVIMDLMMPVVDGVEATRRIREALPETKILILTSYGTSADVARAVGAGATGALVKDTANDELIETIRRIAAGERILSPEIAHDMACEPAPPEFTQRQTDVLKAITRGFTNPEIARMLGISPDAVKQHVIGICEKLGAANRTEAVAIAIRRQLLKI